MFLLPVTTDDFLKTEYWDSFFKKRGKEAFEWYGEYEELCAVLHRYMRPNDNILVIGCGNSSVSSNLYDLGYKNITNIDVSGVVIKRMQQKYERTRPGLKFLQMDALQTDFPSLSFTTVFDKGTLDALFPDNTEDSRNRICQLFNEIDRLLKVGGRYVCISLLQKHILSFVLNHFFEKRWLIRVCRCVEVEKNRADGSCMPVFALVCTKIKKLPHFEPIIEISMDDNNVIRTGKESLVNTIKSIQQAEIVCNGLNKNCLTNLSREAVIEVARPGDSHTRYTITIIDPEDPIPVDRMKFAAFVIPFGKGNDWLFSSEEGRQTLRQNCHVDRVALISMHECHQYPDFKEIQNELTDTIIKLAPKGVTDRGEKVTFLTMSAERKVDEKNVRFEGKSKFSGKYLVEDVVENNEHYRRLIFLNRGTVIQSEVRLKRNNDTQIEEIDLNYISCDYHIFFNVMVSLELAECKKAKYELLLIGLGGGVLATLMNKCFDNVFITAIEIDEDIFKIAKEHFCLKPDHRMNVHIEDGLIFLKNCSKKGMKYDIIVFDVDNKDLTVGMSCPPVSFLEQDILNAVVQSLNDKGIFLLNLVCRSLKLKNSIHSKLRSTFTGVISVKSKEDVNEVVMCWKNGLDISETSIDKATFDFFNYSKENNFVFDYDILNICKTVETI